MNRLRSIDNSKFHPAFKIEELVKGTEVKVLFIDGFLTEETSNVKTWIKQLEIIYPHYSLYSLTWKSSKITDFFNKDHIVQHLITRTLPIHPAIHAPILVTNLVKVWKKTNESAEEMGRILGNLLKNINNEEIIICGHSLGAKVIYNALIQISQQNPKINKKIIKEVHLLGGATSCSADNWDSASRCVSGKIYNYYSMNDEVLKYLYQMCEINTPIGRAPIKASKVNNKKVDNFVSGHTEYISNFRKFVIKVP